MCGRRAVAFLLLSAAFAQAQPALTEPGEFPAVRPGPRGVQSGEGCFHLASGTIVPGDVDWIQVTIPRATTQTVIDVDFPAGGSGSALLASIVNGGTAFNISDNNNSRDALCGLSATTVPVGSTRDSAVNLSATVGNIVINIGVTGAEDINFTGTHVQTFSYDVWIYAATVPCTSDGDCNDGVACTVDTCNGGSGLCSSDEDDDLCDNGRFCDGEEFCDAVRGCRMGNPADCDDGVDCTTDDCDAGSDRCVHSPDDGFCDDGRFCNGEEFCDEVRGCQAGSPPNCDDDVGCTVDRCDATLDECVSDPSDALCDDGRFCNGTERCDAVNDCQAGVPPDCADPLACTADSCDPALDECAHAPDDSLCDDGRFCNGAEVCDASQGCQPGEAPCPDGGCREDDQRCIECSTNADCDDGDFCNGSETCDPSGVCADGAAPCPLGMTCDPDERRCQSGTFSLDIKPGTCPNRFAGSGNDFLRVAVVGAAGAEVRQIDPRSLRLARVDGVGSQVAPHKGWSGPNFWIQDVATPVDGPVCGCGPRAKDRNPDLVVQFSVPALESSLKLDRFKTDTELQFRISGRLRDGTPFEAVDCMTVKGRGKLPKQDR